jgi:iron-sulfur cluster insertion protein
LLQATTQEDQKYATFSIKGGGCSGFTYLWKFANEVDNKEDWIEVDLSTDKKLMINRIAEMYVLGSTIDYVTELGGSYLAVKNPQATSSCGCGESFAV